MPEEGFDDLSSGLTEIDTQITDKTSANSITPVQHGTLLRKILRTVFDISLTGTPGASFLAGAGVPASGLGVEGDLYLRLSNGQVYEKTGELTWTDTGYSLRGQTGATGATGTAGSAGSNGASRDLRVSGTELQTKLSTEDSGSWVAIYDLEDIQPVISVDVDLDLNYRLTFQDEGDAVTLFSFASLASELRTDASVLQWKLTVQADEDYQDLFDFDTITPEFRDNAGTLEWKYLTDVSWTVIGSLGSTAGIDGDKLPMAIPLAGLTPRVQPPYTSLSMQLGSILLGISDTLGAGMLRMKSVQLDPPAISGRTLDFAVSLSDPSNARVVLDNLFVDMTDVTVSALGVMTWPAAGAFETAATSGMIVTLFSV